MRRLLALSFLLAACGGAATKEPAWPKSAGNMTEDDWHDDGGESIDPRQVSDVAAIETADEPLFDFSSLTIDISPDPVPEDTAPPPDAPPILEMTPEETIIIEGDPPPPPGPP